MCNLYSVTKGQSAIRDLFRASRDRAGNLPFLPAIFLDQMAPIVRVTADGERELVMARWGTPGPPQYGGAPVTNIRNLSSPHWRGWLGNRNRCVLPATWFCEYLDTKPRKTPIWFARLRWPMDALARPARPQERSAISLASALLIAAP
jgi:putative SOS response-associated peptidase YedK